MAFLIVLAILYFFSGFFQNQIISFKQQEKNNNLYEYALIEMDKIIKTTESFGGIAKHDLRKKRTEQNIVDKKSLEKMQKNLNKKQENFVLIDIFLGPKKVSTADFDTCVVIERLVLIEDNFQNRIFQTAFLPNVICFSEYFIEKCHETISFDKKILTGVFCAK